MFPGGNLTQRSNSCQGFFSKGVGAETTGNAKALCPQKINNNNNNNKQQQWPRFQKDYLWLSQCFELTFKHFREI